MMRKLLLSLVLLSTILLGGGSVLAQGVPATPPPVMGGTPQGGLLPGPATAAENEGIFYAVQKLIPGAASGFVMVLMLLGTGTIMVAGLIMIIGSEDQALLDQAKGTILWTIIGVGLSIVAFAVVRFIIGINFTT